MLAMLLALPGVSPAGETGGKFAGGAGTRDDPWQIATPGQLDAVRDHLGGHFILIADVDLSAYANWEPIGSFVPLSDAPEHAEVPDPSVAFSGTFDGGGHKIANATIERPMDMAVGLFGCAAGSDESPSSIRNLAVENVDVTGFFLVGGVIGLLHEGCTAENVSLTGNNRIHGLQGVGGIVGTSFDDVKGC